MFRKILITTLLFLSSCYIKDKKHPIVLGCKYSYKEPDEYFPEIYVYVYKCPSGYDVGDYRPPDHPSIHEIKKEKKSKEYDQDDDDLFWYIMYQNTQNPIYIMPIMD